MYDHCIEDLTYAMERLVYDIAKKFVGIGRTEINFDVVVNNGIEKTLALLLSLKK